MEMIRKALLVDGRRIQELINFWADRGEMLHRPLNEVYENIRDFFVFERDGKILGVAGLHISWEALAEIRSLAVREGEEGKGIGKRLTLACLEEARTLGVMRVFTLTYKAGFFEKVGFTLADKSQFPQKVWGDCIRCHKFPDCDETALIYHCQDTSP